MSNVKNFSVNRTNVQSIKNVSLLISPLATTFVNAWTMNWPLITRRMNVKLPQVSWITLLSLSFLVNLSTITISRVSQEQVERPDQRSAHSSMRSNNKLASIHQKVQQIVSISVLLKNGKNSINSKTSLSQALKESGFHIGRRSTSIRRIG